MKSVTNNSNDSSNNKNNSKTNLKRSISANPKQKSKKSTSVTNNNCSPPVNTSSVPQPQTPVTPVKIPIRNEASTSSHGKEKVF